MQRLPLSAEKASELWRLAANDEAWPLTVRDEAAFLHYVETFHVGSWFTKGGIWLFSDRGQPVGFASLHEIGAEHLAGSLHGQLVMEGGTYLLPAYRGTGRNQMIKRELLVEARKMGAALCVFSVPVRNARALRAFTKLPWPIEVLRSDTPLRSHPLTRYCRYKAWQCGEAVTAFAIDPRQIPASPNRTARQNADG